VASKKPAALDLEEFRPKLAQAEPTPDQAVNLDEFKPAAKPVNTEYFDRLKRNSYDDSGAVDSSNVGLGAGGRDAVERGLIRGVPLIGGLQDRIRAAVRGVTETPGGRAVIRAVPGVGPIADALLGDEKDSTYGERLAEERQTDDDARKDHPAASFIAETTSAIASPSLVGKVKAVGLAGRAAQAGVAAGEAAVTGGAGTRQDLSTAEGWKEAGKEALGYGAVGLGLNLLGQAGGKVFEKIKAKIKGGKEAADLKLAGIESPEDLQPGTRKLESGAEVKTPGKAEQTYRHQTLDAIGNGATPTAKTRAWPNEGARNNALDFVENNPAMKEAVKTGDQEKIFEEAQRVGEELAPKTKPYYKDFDRYTLVPVEELDRKIAAEIEDLKTPGRRNERSRISELEQLRSDLKSYAKAHGGENITHQELRDLTSSFLKEKNQVVGSQAQTPNYVFREENHKLLNDFLNEHLQNLQKAHPELQLKVQELKDINRQLATARGIADVSEDALLRAERTSKTRAAEVVREAKRVEKALQSTTAVGAVAETARRIANAKTGIPTSPEALGKYTEELISKYGQKARDIRLGKVTDVPSAAEEMRHHGVPERVVRIFLALRQPEDPSKRTPAP
jgi:hypothetical protein